MSQTHRERLVRRGWRRLAGVRSTWPPPLTARCRRSQLSSVFCLLYGAAASTVRPVALVPEAVQNLRAEKKRKSKNIHVSLQMTSNVFIYRRNLSFTVREHNRWTHHGVIILARAALMASCASSCHQVTCCELLNRPSAELIRGEIRQTLSKECVCVDSVVCSVKCVNSPISPTTDSRGETGLHLGVSRDCAA